MSTAQSPQRNPRQTLLVPGPAYSDIPLGLLNVDPAPSIPSSSSTAGFFTLPAAVPAAPKATLTALNPLAAMAEPTPTPEVVEVPEQVATVPEMEVNEVDVAAVDVTEMATLVVTSTAVATGTQSAVAEPQTSAVTTSPGSIAMGSIGRPPSSPSSVP